MSTTTEIEHVELDRLAKEIGEEVTAAERNWQDAVGHAIQAGHKLIEAKSLVKHGQWLPWVEEHFPGTRKTASNYMRLAQMGNAVAHLPTVRDALDALAGPRQGKLPSGEGDEDEAQAKARYDEVRARRDKIRRSGARVVAAYADCEHEMHDDDKARLGPLVLRLAVALAS